MDIAGLVNGWASQETEINRLKRLEKKMGSARLKGKTHCIKCGYCCYKRTCIPTPKELKKIAKFLKLTAKELINKYYVIDRLNNSVYFIKPVGKNIKDLVGKFIPSNRTFKEGRCIFLNKTNKCEIYVVRPNSAKNMKCWKDEEFESSSKSWEGDKLKKEFGIDGEELEFD